MKKVLLLFFLLAFPMMTLHAVLPMEPISLQPKDNPEIDNPIKRTPMRTPVIGIEGAKLVRLQAATNLLYYLEVLQDNEVVYSSNWNFQDEELSMPSDLQGEYEIVLSDGSKSFVGTFVI